MYSFSFFCEINVYFKNRKRSIHPNCTIVGKSDYSITDVVYS